MKYLSLATCTQSALYEAPDIHQYFARRWEFRCNSFHDANFRDFARDFRSKRICGVRSASSCRVLLILWSVNSSSTRDFVWIRWRLNQLICVTGHQGRLLHWSMDAACVLEKTRGERKSCIFLWKLGGRKIKGGRKTKLLKHICIVFLLFSQKFSRSLRSLAYILFSSPIQGTRNIYGRDGKVRLAFKSGTKSVDLPSHFWWPDVTKLITQNLN